MSTDGTMPLRAVFRCLVKKTSNLWKKQDRSQAMFRPEDIFITHLTLYAVAPHQCHEFHVYNSNPEDIGGHVEAERLMRETKAHTSESCQTPHTRSNRWRTQFVWCPLLQR